METVAVIGLLLNFFGTVTVAVFGIPQPDLRYPSEDVMLSYGRNQDYESEKARVDDRRRAHNLRARTGLGAIAVGFMLQLISYV